MKILDQKFKWIADRNLIIIPGILLEAYIAGIIISLIDITYI